MMIQWTTRHSDNPTVRWGPASGNYTHSAPAATHTYRRDEMRGAPANSTGWLDPGALHRAVMTGLKSGATVFYTFGDEVGCYQRALLSTRCMAADT